MTQRIRRTAVSASLILATALCASGCGREAGSQSQARLPIERLTVLYADYMAQYGQGPKTLEEFKRYLANEGVTKVAKYGITDVESLFLSERDGRPFVIIYGIVPARPLTANAPPVMSYERPVPCPTCPEDAQEAGQRGVSHAGCIVAYEQEGADGQRRITYLTVGGDPVEVEEMAKQQVPGLK